MLAPHGGATLAPACWDSAVGTRGCLPPPLGRAAKHQCPLPESIFPSAGLCLPLPGYPPSVCWPRWHAASHQHGPTLLGDALGRPPRTSASRVFAAEQAGERLSQEPMPVATDTKCPRFGARGEAATQEVPALQLLACSGPGAVPAGLRASLPAWDGATPVGAKERGTALAVHSLQLCLTDNTCSTTGSRVQRRGGGVSALPP